jgi:hypothetical protein
MQLPILFLILTLSVAAASLTPASSELKQLKQVCRAQLESADGGEQKVDKVILVWGTVRGHLEAAGSSGSQFEGQLRSEAVAGIAMGRSTYACVRVCPKPFNAFITCKTG